MNLKKVFWVWIFTLSVISCASDKTVKNENYWQEGFINSDCFQLIINVPANKEAQGLVNQRASAFREAGYTLDEAALEKLSTYCIEYNLKKNNIVIKDKKQIANINEIIEILKRKLKKFIQPGFIALQYFDEDNSVNIVYRIKKRKLQEKIESIQLAIKVTP